MRIYIVGIGADGDKTLTKEAREIIAESDVVIGAKRMVFSVDTKGKDVFISYNTDEIQTKIQHCDEESVIVILMSGDPGFYSGAKNMLAALSEQSVIVIPGISSMSAFFARMKLEYDDAYFCSLHGRKSSICKAVATHKKVFTLLDGREDVCEKLTEYGLGDCNVYVGSRLYCPEERLRRGVAKYMIHMDFDPLSVMVIINENAKVRHCIADHEFVRDRVPMTKSDIRAMNVAKLNLQESDILYDIGAGSGSVAIESAYHCQTVYAVEKNPLGVMLIEENKRRFGMDNIEVIEGTAPEILENLPVPDKVFIGGSGHALEEILHTVFSKNKNVKIVLNAITLETIAETLKQMKQFGLEYEITCVQVAKSHLTGSYTMMQGENPIYIVEAEL